MSHGLGEAESVNQVSEIAWIDPAKSAITNNASGTTSVPSPRQNASEDIASEEVIGVPNATIDEGPLQVLVHDVIHIDLPLVDDFPAVADIRLKQIALGSHYYATDDSSGLYFVDEGVIAVFLCGLTATQNNDECTYIQNHFGGVVLRTTGSVYSYQAQGLSDILVAWSSSDVNACYQQSPSTITLGGDTVDVMAYECVYAGNCDVTSASDGIGIGNGCSSIVTDAQIASRNVGPGGEFGEIGLLGLKDRTGAREQVCFLEDTSDHSLAQNVLLYGAAAGEQGDEDYILPVTKRSYVSRRRTVDNSEASEGINVSFTNHNFLIIDRGTGNSTSEGCYDEVVAHSEVLASRKIIRALSTDNTVVSEVDYNGGSGPAITLIGTASASTNLNLYVSGAHTSNDEPGACYIKSDGLAYACVVPSTASTVAIEGGSATYPASSTAYATCERGVSTVAPTLVSTLDPLVADGCDWSTDF